LDQFPITLIAKYALEHKGVRGHRKAAAEVFRGLKIDLHQAFKNTFKKVMKVCDLRRV
jgi:hypothetical protein